MPAVSSVTGSKTCAAPRADDQRGARFFPASRPWAWGAAEAKRFRKKFRKLVPPVGVGSGRRPGRDAHGLEGGRYRRDDADRNLLWKKFLNRIAAQKMAKLPPSDASRPMTPMEKVTSSPFPVSPRDDSDHVLLVDPTFRR